jgi:hypothetical protein
MTLARAVIMPDAELLEQRDLRTTFGERVSGGKASTTRTDNQKFAFVHAGNRTAQEAKSNTLECSSDPEAFVNRWQRSTLKERSSSQSHFNELCHLLGVSDPLGSDPDGSSYTFERPVKKVTGGKGFADVWKRGAFAWEYKGGSNTRFGKPQVGSEFNNLK